MNNYYMKHWKLVRSSWLEISFRDVKVTIWGDGDVGVQSTGPNNVISGEAFNELLEIRELLLKGGKEW